MIIFLYGQDTYRLNQKLKEVIKQYKKIHKSGLNLKFFEKEDLDFQGLQDKFQQASMFKEKRLMVLKDIFSNQEFKKKFLESGQNFVDSEDIILIAEKNKIPQNEPLFNFLKQKGTCQEFRALTKAQLKNWVKKEFGKFEAKIHKEALETLIEFVGNDLWQLSNEIKKLVSYKGVQKEILKEDVELLVKAKIESDIFKTIDFIAQNNKKQALALLRKHLEKGDSPLYLLSMINFQFRNLLMIRDLIEKSTPFYLISRKTNLHPYVVKKSYSQAKKFQISELKKIYQKIFEVDLNIKTGKIEPETALELLIAQI